MNLQLNAEERIDLRRAVRDHIDALKDAILRDVEAGEMPRVSPLRMEEVRRYEALLARIRGLSE